MFRRFKHRLLSLLIDDISKQLIEKRGYVYLKDMRTCMEIDWLAREAWKLKAEDKENT